MLGGVFEFFLELVVDGESVCFHAFEEVVVFTNGRYVFDIKLVGGMAVVEVWLQNAHLEFWDFSGRGARYFSVDLQHPDGLQVLVDSCRGFVMG